ncbi:hypothetical protein LXL04_001538 [Taraxacum kok-saghyz]
MLAGNDPREKGLYQVQHCWERSIWIRNVKNNKPRGHFRETVADWGCVQEKMQISSQNRQPVSSQQGQHVFWTEGQFWDFLVVSQARKAQIMMNTPPNPPIHSKLISTNFSRDLDSNSLTRSQNMTKIPLVRILHFLLYTGSPVFKFKNIIKINNPSHN